MNEQPLPQASASETQIRPRFSLSAIFYLMAVYAAGLPFGLWTIVLTTLVLGAWCILLVLKYRLLIGLLVLGCVLYVLLAPSIQHSHIHWVRTPSQNAVRQLTLSIIIYESGRMAFPPAYKTDEAGKPIHSWRVLMLPNLGEEALYAKYDFDEPWDGPNNIKLLDQMPEVFSCRMKDSPANLTPYKLVVDKGTPFEGGQTHNYGAIKDGSSNTFAIIEDLSNPVPWTKPDDLTIEQAVALLSECELSEIPRAWDSQFTKTLNGPAVSLFDGSTHSFLPNANQKVIRNLCMCDDGNVVNIKSCSGDVTLVRWDRYAALFAYIILLLLPGLIAFFLGAPDIKRRLRATMMKI